MEGTTNLTKPKVDAAYWFNYSEALVGKGLETRDRAAAAIQTLAVWLWGIYTASAAIGFVLSGKELAFWPTLAIAAASASLIAVYWGTIWVQMPILVGFDPRSPDDIKNVYVANVKAKDRRLRVTLALSVLAGTMVSVALIVASVSKPDKPSAPGFSASINTRDGERTLSVTGYVGKTKNVIVQVQPASLSTPAADSQSFIYMPTENGLLQTSIPLHTKAIEVLITVEWEDANGMKIQLSRKAREEQKPEQKKKSEENKAAGAS